MSQQTWIIVIGIVVFLVIAIVAALIWWHFADVMFPGTDRKTGQRIFSKGERNNEGATVVKGFGETPPPGESS